MRVKKDVLLRDIAGEHILVPTGSGAANLLGILSLNDCGVFLWKLLKEEKTERQLIDALLEEYDVEAERACADIRNFIGQLKEAGLLEEEGE
ncbi:MAG: PqqD family protein [Eubacteriales bacterium]